MKYFVYAILIFACIVTFIWVRDVQRTVHGSVSPDFCTDCPQFEKWLEDQNE